MRCCASRPAADHLLVDAVCLDCELPQNAIIHGDALSASIAAASILAKVERDRMMCEWDAVFPEYGLASHKGYSTPQHLAALQQYGPTPAASAVVRPGVEFRGGAGSFRVRLTFRKRFLVADWAVPSRTLLCFVDLRQQVGLGFVALQVSVALAAVVIDLVGFVVVGVLDEKFEGRGGVLAGP